MNPSSDPTPAALLQAARDCLNAPKPDTSAGRDELYAQFSRAIRGLYESGILNSEPGADADENFDNISKWFGRAFAPMDHPWRGESRAALGTLFEKLDHRIQTSEERHGVAG